MASFEVTTEALPSLDRFWQCRLRNISNGFGRKSVSGARFSIP